MSAKILNVTIEYLIFYKVFAFFEQILTTAQFSDQCKTEKPENTVAILYIASHPGQAGKSYLKYLMLFSIYRILELNLPTVYREY